MSLELDRSSWTRVKFGDVVTNVNNNTKDPGAHGIDRVIGLEHLDPGELRIQRWGDLSDETTFTRRVRAGQTLFGKRRAYQRKTAYAEFDAVCSGDILIFESADTARLLPELLPFVAMTDGFYEKALETSAGSLSPRTRWADLAKYEFDLPPLDQQRRIADLLWASVKHVAACRAQIDAHRVAARQAVNSAVQELRGDRVELRELCNATVGVVVKPAQYYVTEGGVPAIRATNVFPGRFDLDSLVHFDSAAEASMNKTRIRTGDVIVVRTGRTGEAATATPSVVGMNTIGVIIARPKAPLLSGFLECFLASESGKAQIAQRTAGSAQPNLNVAELLGIRIPRVPIEEQSAVVAIAESWNGAGGFLEKELSAAQVLASSLLEEVLIG